MLFKIGLRLGILNRAGRYQLFYLCPSSHNMHRAYHACMLNSRCNNTYVSTGKKIMLSHISAVIHEDICDHSSHSVPGKNRINAKGQSLTCVSTFGRQHRIEHRDSYRLLPSRFSCLGRIQANGGRVAFDGCSELTAHFPPRTTFVTLGLLTPRSS